MTFSFQCPAGHLLQAESDQVGLHSRCPVCGVLMKVPAAPPVAFVVDESSPSPSVSESAPLSVELPVIDVLKPEAPKFYHIPCPNGHELETPAEMVGQYVMCPTCNAQFQLAEQDSVEYQQRKQIESETREARSGRSWLNWAISIVVLVLLGLAALILVSILG